MKQPNAALYTRSLIEASFDPLVTIDSDGKITDLNEATVRATGIAREALVGSKIADYFVDPEMARSHYREVYAKGTVNNYRLAIRHTSGKLTQVLINASLYYDEKRRGPGVLLVAHNVTERGHAELALQKVNRTFKTISAANGALLRAKSERELLDDMCRIAVEVGGYRLAWIGFVEHDDAKTLRPMAWAGEHPEYIQTANITWSDTERGRGPDGTAIRTGEVQVNQNVDANPVMAPWRADWHRFDFKAGIALPLKNASEVFGLFMLCAAEVDTFAPNEIAMLKDFAANLAFGICAQRAQVEREATLSALRGHMKSTIAAIAAMVETHDAYIADHQRHVAQLAAAIAHQIGQPEKQIEGIVLAATILDVGMITVPTEILSKPGKLTPVEYKVVHAHPKSGYEIIKDIDFPWPIAQAILQHHERLDGSGYPSNLKGDEILVEAKILAVSDVVDTMISYRPYRPALNLDAALDEVETGKGRLYDPSAVDACITLFRQKGFAFH